MTSTTAENNFIFQTEPPSSDERESRTPLSSRMLGSAHFLRTGKPARSASEPTIQREKTTLNDLTIEISNTNPDLILQLESISQGKPDLQHSVHGIYYKEEPVNQTRDEEYDTDLEYDEEDVGVSESVRQEKHDLTGSLNYIRRCSELGVVPVSYFLRHHDNPDFVMRFHGLGPLGTLALSRPLEKNTHITNLSLEGNCIESDGVISLCKMLNENLYITELGLADNCLGNSAVSYLYELLVNNNRIIKLDLSANALTDKSGAELSEMVSRNTTLRHLNLRHNRFGDMSGTVFKDMLYNNDTLQELDLSWNLIRTSAALLLADGLKENVGLKVLRLRMNGFGLEGSKAIGHALIHNRTIQELDLSANRIPLEGAAALAKAINVNESLVKLRLGSNPFGSAGALLIINGARSNDISAIRLIDLIDVFVNGEFIAVKIAFVAERPGLRVLHGVSESDAMRHKKMIYDDSVEV